MAAAHDFSVGADAGLITEAFDEAHVLIGGGAKDLGIVRERAMRERRHDAAGTRYGDLDTDFGADGDGAADPIVFGEGNSGFGIDDKVGTEAFTGEVAIGIRGGEGAESGGAHDVDACVIEESSGLAAGGWGERLFEGARSEGELHSFGRGGEERDIGAEGGAELLHGSRRVIGSGDMQCAIVIEAGVPQEHVRELAHLRGAGDFPASGIVECERAVSG